MEGTIFFFYVKVYVWVLAYLNTPPSPHEVAQHDSKLELCQKIFNFILDFGPFLSISQRLFVLVIFPAMSQTITLYKIPF